MRCAQGLDQISLRYLNQCLWGDRMRDGEREADLAAIANLCQ